RRMTELARKYHESGDIYGAAKLPDNGTQPARAKALLDRALTQMAREPLLAQSSDWAFLMKTGTAKNYATKRTKDHILRFTRLYDQVRAEVVDEEFLTNCEWRDNIFPNLNWRVYV